MAGNITTIFKKLDNQIQVALYRHHKVMSLNNWKIILLQKREVTFSDDVLAFVYAVFAQAPLCNWDHSHTLILVPWMNCNPFSFWNKVDSFLLVRCLYNKQVIHGYLEMWNFSLVLCTHLWNINTLREIPYLHVLTRYSLCKPSPRIFKRMPLFKWQASGSLYLSNCGCTNIMQSQINLNMIANRKWTRKRENIILGSDGIFFFFSSFDENLTSSSASSPLSSAVSISAGSVVCDLDAPLPN